MIQTILRNGTIYTVEGAEWENRPAEAMALTEEGIIAAVGAEDDVLKLREEQTVVLDLERNTVLPGLIDSHAHMPGKAFAELFQINLFGVMDREPALVEIRTFIDRHPNYTSYFGMGFNMGMVDEEGKPPCAAWLDEICSDKPVQLSSYDMHSRWLNSKALEVCNITKDTPDPAMGHIHRDEWGNPTGLLTDCQSIPLMQMSFTREQCVQATTRFVKTMNAWGYTAINSIAPHQQTSPYIYQDVQANGDLTARITTAQFIRHTKAAEDLETLQGMKKDLDSDLIKVTTAKYLIDGVVEGYTAYLKEPYDEAAGLGADYNSYPEWTVKELAESFERVMNEGFSVHCHSIGDAATSMVLDALEEANAISNGATQGKGTYRNVITHLQLVDPSDISRMAQLGVIAAIQPFWHFKEPGFFNTVELIALGKDRAEKEYPAKSFVDAGILITASGDFPVSQENNPFYGIKAGVIRNLYNNEDFGKSISDPDDERFLLGKEERLTVPQMIEAYTINGAYQLFREDEIGSLIPGKKADYIVIDRDPLAIDVMDLDKIQLLQTVFNGKVVYDRT